MTDKTLADRQPTGEEQLGDEVLMLRVRAGEVDALGVLFERHHTRLYQFCRRLGASATASEDLVQEVFARMLRYRHTFRGDSRFAPWMYRLARNASIDAYRRAPRHEVPAAADHDMTDPAPDAQADLERSQAERLLWRAFDYLPLEKREVLVLARVEAREYREIAHLLGCSEGAVRVRVHRALAALRVAYLDLLALAERQASVAAAHQATGS